MFKQDTKILVVDDLRMMRKIVINALRTLNFTDIMEADDGATAWTILEKAAMSEKKVGLVISDFSMPVMNGIDLLKAVRAHASMKDTPFIMVTAQTEQQTVVAAVQEKVSGYIIKPFSIKTFRAKLEIVYKKISSSHETGCDK